MVSLASCSKWRLTHPTKCHAQLGIHLRNTVMKAIILESVKIANLACLAVSKQA